ncbi:MAG: AAA family ATPase [Alphaproteobacteria bacterium]|nr:AAA family ATPase [Alphaproteobacteria bacterium]
MAMRPPKTPGDWDALSYEALQLFSPSTPVDEAALFAGRQPEVRRLIESILEKGKHVVLYGERGVGKTSLVKVLNRLFPTITSQLVLMREQVDPTDTFSSIWMKVFRDIELVIRVDGKERTVSVADLQDAEIKPDDIRRELERAFTPNEIPVIVIDEFDKASDSSIKKLMANTMKYLSDYAVNVTLIIVGVADDIGELLEEHESISRYLEQIPMPRMSNSEMKEIISKRLPRLSMKIEPDALWKIITLSRGLPAYVHLLGMYAVQDAARTRRLTITESNVNAAIKRALVKSQESVQRDYAAATHTNRTDTLFKEVLLACALAQTDERGMFSPNAVVLPLAKITRRAEVQIANFQNHLKKFISPERNRILIRKGKERAYKFRFRDPMMQPFVIMKGVEDGLVDPTALDVLSSPEQPELPIIAKRPV